MADIFDQPRGDFVPIANTATDADSPNSALLMEKIRDAIEMLILNVHGSFENSTLTSDPPNDTTGYLIDTAAGFTDDEHNGRRVIFTDGNAKGQDFLIDDTDAGNNRCVCTGDNLYTAGARSGDSYRIIGNFRSASAHNHDQQNSPQTTLPDGLAVVNYGFVNADGATGVALTPTNVLRDLYEITGAPATMVSKLVYVPANAGTLRTHVKVQETDTGTGSIRSRLGTNYSDTETGTWSTATTFNLDIDCSAIAEGWYVHSIQLSQADFNDVSVFYYQSIWIN